MLNKGHEKMSRMKTLLWEQYNKYKEIILYGVFGVLTTAINLLAYWFLALLAGVEQASVEGLYYKFAVLSSTAIAWLVAVIFAYVTNRKYVFESTASGKKAVAKEMALFFASRIATLIFDLLFMYVTVTVLFFDDFMMKIVSNIFVIIGNYVLSKMMVFRQGQKREK